MGTLLKKVCTACGVDVSQQKRVKDQQGQYFCHPCWSYRVAVSRIATNRVVPPIEANCGLIPTPPAVPPTLSANVENGPSVVAFGDAVAGESEKAKSNSLTHIEKSVITGGIVVAITLIGLTLYFFVFRDRWENQNHQAMLSLLTDATQLRSRGDLTGANDKYTRLFRLVGNRHIHDTSLLQEISAARNAAAAVDAQIAMKEAERQDVARKEQEAEKKRQELEQLNQSRAAQATMVRRREIADTWLAFGKVQSNLFDLQQLEDAQRRKLEALVERSNSLGDVKSEEIDVAQKDAKGTLTQITASSERAMALLDKLKTFDDRESGQVAAQILEDTKTPNKYKPYIRKLLE